MSVVNAPIPKPSSVFQEVAAIGRRQAKQEHRHAAPAAADEQTAQRPTGGARQEHTGVSIQYLTEGQRRLRAHCHGVGHGCPPATILTEPTVHGDWAQRDRLMDRRCCIEPSRVGAGNTILGVDLAFRRGGRMAKLGNPAAQNDKLPAVLAFD